VQLRFLLLVILACLLSACTSTQVRHAEGIVAKSAVAKGKRLLLMPPEVEITEMLASGIQEPRPEWTQAAKQYIAQSLAEILKQSQTELIAYAAPADEAFRDRTRQLELLHQAVGGSIAAFGFRNLLPSKHDRFDWTLGPGVVVLRSASRRITRFTPMFTTAMPARAARRCGWWGCWLRSQESASVCKLATVSASLR